MVTNLLDNTNTWILQLPSTFIFALSVELVDTIDDDKDFTMPDSTTLNTKSKHLNALCAVKTLLALTVKS